MASLKITWQPLTMALREAIKDQDNPGEMVKAILALTRTAGAAQPKGNGQARDLTA